MLRLLKLRSVTQGIFSFSAFKILPTVKRDGKLLLLRFLTYIKNHNLKHDSKAEPPNLDKIILFKCKNSQYFTKLKLLSSCNFILWSLFGISLYDSLSKEPKFLNDQLKQSWSENEETRNLTKKLICASITLGILFVLGIWFYLARSVRQIVLMKNTKVVTFQTYSFIPGLKEFSVPLNDVSGVISRHNAKGHIPLKLRNTLFYYLIDAKGEFPNTFIFDNSVGVIRDFNKYDDQ